MNEKGGHVGDHQTNANCFFHHPLIKGYLKFVDWMNWCVKGIGGLFLTAMSLAVFGSVLSRFAVNISWSWIEEGAIFLMIWVVMLGATLAFRSGHMIAVEALVMNLPYTTWKIVKTVVGMFSIAFLLILVIVGYDLAQLGADKVSITLPWLRMYWVYLAIPVGAFMMCLNVIANLIELWGTEVVKE